MSPEGRVLRLVHFRPIRSEFDGFLRTDLIPDLRRLPGLIDVHVGRRSDDQGSDRLVASIWSDRDAMVAAVGADLGESTFHPERLAETTDRTLQVLDLDIVLTFDPPKAPTLMRLFRGVVRAGELDAYIDVARTGTQADAVAGRGPYALYLAADPPDRFVTVSLWPSWQAIELATGGDIHRPMTTKDSSRLVDMDIAHYEIVAGA
jgi:heme-degrading monooxygenase HmoA